MKLVESELGSDWARKVAPSFDARRAVLLDDRWASVREDFARVWVGDDSARERSFTGLDDAALGQARWWLDRARREQRTDLVSFYGSTISAAERELEWADDVAVVTGAAPGSIAGAVVADLLRGGATVVATTSRLDKDRLAFFRGLYRDHASNGAALWVLPANLASYADVDSLVEWISSPVVESAGGMNDRAASGALADAGLPVRRSGGAGHGGRRRPARRGRVPRPALGRRAPGHRSGRTGRRPQDRAARARRPAGLAEPWPLRWRRCLRRGQGCLRRVRAALAGREGLGAAGLARARPHRLGARHRPDGSQRPAGRRRHRGRGPHLVARRRWPPSCSSCAARRRASPLPSRRSWPT